MALQILVSPLCPDFLLSYKNCTTWKALFLPYQPLLSISIDIFQVQSFYIIIAHYSELYMKALAIIPVA